MIRTILIATFGMAALFQAPVALAAQSGTAVGVSLRIVDACGVQSQTSGVQVRCRSTTGAASSSRISPAQVSTQWCRGDRLTGDNAGEPVCSATRAPGHDQQLLVATF